MILIFLHASGAVLGQLMYVCRSRRYSYCLINLHLCFPKESEARIQQLAQQTMREMGKAFFEMVFALLWPKFYRGTIRNVIGEQCIQDVQQQKKSIILAGPHLGNWEVLNVYAGQYQPYASYKPLLSQWMDRWLRRCRETPGTKLVSIHADGLKSMCGELGKGGMIMMFPDQLPSDSAGRTMAPFFNIPVWTGTLVSRLAQRDNVSIICGFARRLPMGRGFDIYLEAAPDEVYSSLPAVSAAALNKGMESCIRHCVSQYVWQYRRFKDNMPGIYRAAKISPRTVL